MKSNLYDISFRDNEGRTVHLATVHSKGIAYIMASAIKDTYKDLTSDIMVTQGTFIAYRIKTDGPE